MNEDYNLIRLYAIMLITAAVYGVVIWIGKTTERQDD